MRRGACAEPEPGAVKRTWWWRGGGGEGEREERFVILAVDFSFVTLFQFFFCSIIPLFSLFFRTQLSPLFLHTTFPSASKKSEAGITCTPSSAAASTFALPGESPATTAVVFEETAEAAAPPAALTAALSLLRVTLGTVPVMTKERLERGS